jgi:hypothetical protein
MIREFHFRLVHARTPSRVGAVLASMTYLETHEAGHLRASRCSPRSCSTCSVGASAAATSSALGREARFA